MKEKYRPARKKAWVLIAFAVIFIILAYSIYQNLAFGGDLYILSLLVIAFLVLIPLAIFFIDLIWWEYQ